MAIEIVETPGLQQGETGNPDMAAAAVMAPEAPAVSAPQQPETALPERLGISSERLRRIVILAVAERRRRELIRGGLARSARRASELYDPSSEPAPSRHHAHYDD